ncbi:hypothetical protein HYH03_004339 [Edaphochlamys debaryana]|uniref:EF-hand domain-containing protein n=1 Tax=Edaphochlamys debaryana TaxID=47281 RepID=A0A836C3A0_9CHLO|nr:hypothetical protein HYH03_004339 [Edaphochlamys debaryana]|eukprot:KAG2497593.1 hypothetical protein HYH03_004339 [Edaphochlamys debaryana]
MAEGTTAGINLAEYGFSDEQIANFREAFAMFDKDGDGTVSTKELHDVFDQLGIQISDDQVCELVNNYDIDNDGTMTLPEFCVLMAKANLVPDDPVAELRVVFNEFDRNGDNRISADELRALMLRLKEKLTREDVDQIFEAAGCKQKGYMSFRNFQALMRSSMV